MTHWLRAIIQLTHNLIVIVTFNGNQKCSSTRQNRIWIRYTTLIMAKHEETMFVMASMWKFICYVIPDIYCILYSGARHITRGKK